MKTILITFIIILIVQFSFGQSLKRYPVGSSGCSIYTFCDPGTFDISYSDDSSTVYTGECDTPDSLTYGVICVKLKQPANAGQEAEDLMIAYLDYLKTAFNIVSSAGYGKGHTMERKTDARGVIDYWKDDKKDEWKIKSWTDGKIIAVMYVYANGNLDETKKINVFLNGFRFPGM